MEREHEESLGAIGENRPLDYEGGDDGSNTAPERYRRESALERSVEDGAREIERTHSPRWMTTLR